MDFTIVYCVTLISYGKALYLHFYYLTIWTHCTCMYVYILSEIKFYYYFIIIIIKEGILFFVSRHTLTRFLHCIVRIDCQCLHERGVVA